jgi:hypothetical protein
MTTKFAAPGFKPGTSLIDAVLEGLPINMDNADQYISQSLEEDRRQAHNQMVEEKSAKRKTRKNASLEFTTEHADTSRKYYGAFRRTVLDNPLDNFGGYAFRTGCYDWIFSLCVVDEAARELGMSQDDLFKIYRVLGSIIQRRLLDGHPCGIPYLGTMAIRRIIMPPEVLMRKIEHVDAKVRKFRRALEDLEPGTKRYETLSSVIRRMTGLKINLMSAVARVQMTPVLYQSPKLRAFYASNCKWYAAPKSIFSFANLSWRAKRIKKSLKDSSRPDVEPQPEGIPDDFPRIRDVLRDIKKKVFFTDEGLLEIPEEMRKRYFLDRQCYGYDRTADHSLTREERLKIKHDAARAIHAKNKKGRLSV